MMVDRPPRIKCRCGGHSRHPKKTKQHSGTARKLAIRKARKNHERRR